MTTINDVTAAQMAMALGLECEEPERICLTPEGAAALQKPLEEMTLEELWDRREEYAAESRDLSYRKGKVEAEVIRRISEAHPDFTQEDGGTVQIAGENIILTLGYAKEYDWDSAVLIEASTHLTTDEYLELVKWVPKADGRVYNTLLKRGGQLAEILGRARHFKGARPELKAKARS